MSLPAAVQAQVDAANAALKSLNTPAGQQPAEATSASGQRWVAGTPQTPPGSPAPPAPEVAAAPSMEERLRQAEQRYAVLQGKYNAETAALRSQTEQQSLVVQQLLEKQTAAPAPAPASPQTPEEQLKALGISDEAIKDYGELLPIMAQLAQNMYRPTIEKLEKELNTLRSQASTQAARAAQTTQEGIHDALTFAVPAWRTINDSPHFLEWLKVHDIFAGVTRHVALANAYKALDKARVVGIFEAYAREYPEQARAPGAPLVDPATLVTPQLRGDQPPAAPEGSGSKRMISEQEIEAFYARVRKKLVSPEDYARFQNEIAAATREGRVIPRRPQFQTNSA